MSKIILLNGPGSSGKTSIAKAIQYLCAQPWITFGIDTFIEMTPYPVEGQKNIEYFSFVEGSNDQGLTKHVKTNEQGEKLFACMADFSEILANKGNNIIIDEVLFNDDHLKSYVQKLSNHTVYFVGVYCDLSVMQNREVLRRNRAIGLSNDQCDRVHAGLREYDLTVNTTQSDFFCVAKEILSFIENHENPQGFCKMRKYSDEEIIAVIEKLLNGEGEDEDIALWSETELKGLNGVFDLIFWSNEILSPENILKKARELNKPILL